MPVTYEIDAVDRVIRTSCTSPLTYAEVIEHFRELGRDPACMGPLNVLLDVSEADVPPQGGQIQAINMELSALRDKVQFEVCAIVATRDAMFGMMRMFEALARPYFLATRVFRARPEAEAWLALERSGRNSGR